MSITASELVWRRPANSSDAGSNGGRMTHSVIPHNVKNNVWPDVNQSEREAGSTKYRKVFIHVANDDDLALIQARTFVETNTPGDDAVFIFPGTFTDTQSSITGSERLYGCAKLNANVLAGASSISVMTEGAAFNYLRDGDKVRISDKASVDAATGNEVIATISGAPSYVGNVATVTLAEPLPFGFSAANTRVSSIYYAGDVRGEVASFVRTSAGGTYDTTNYPVAVDSIGGIEQNWTVTFTSATAFSCVGDTVGAVGTGNVASTFQPTNPNFAKPYFVMPAAAFGGTYAIGDTITFTTHPAAIPLWYKRVIPAGANSLTGNRFVVGVDGESE